MHKSVSRALWGALFVGGLTVLGAGAANAAETSGEDGIASGNQVGVLGTVPVTIVGNAVSILGDSESAAVAVPASTGESPTGTQSTSGADGIASGNQVIPDIVAPITVIGNSISVIGDSSMEGSRPSDTPAADPAPVVPETSGENAVAGGNQVVPAVTVPIVVAGNSISVIGDSSADGTQPSVGTADGGSDGATATTNGEDAVGSGNQVVPSVDLPIIAAGNDVSVIRNTGFIEETLLATPLLEHRYLLGEAVLSEPVLGAPILAEPVISSPLVAGLLLGGMNLDVLTPGVVSEPVETGNGIADGSSGVAGDGEAAADATADVSGVITVAASSPRMMLAATGVEALPLIGGIVLMLGAGLGLCAFVRRTATLL